ncbi:hypothetical protein H9M94_01065 [Mycoplasma sp. Pen4]|uniref:hypothetical protein n=1 Tax=Mycoplasma sp. Pen4 TaxID=640330 RepID=UPI0016549334|nr:hypothetical protein [Mycoplasma sp. Pen4]QNM93753.1 hypothetical protein H9M94_00550 [Mycoplasma sp. Pen4]QNM93846.1 hypothetical protein H9M94_01050 [Mycoplasma sp. Pen4]QNM93849.1 hypothetical protein H9M94_01065 [Mycoplasma sp. Pen4]
MFDISNRKDDVFCWINFEKFNFNAFDKVLPPCDDIECKISGFQHLCIENNIELLENRFGNNNKSLHLKFKNQKDLSKLLKLFYKLDNNTILNSVIKVNMVKTKEYTLSWKDN